VSNALFPSLPGLAFDVGKSPMFSTDVKTSVSGREMRRANWAHPIYQIALTYEFLRDELTFDELKTLAGFYMQRQGSFDPFLFTDPDDYQVINGQFGTGDGVTTAFQLEREFGGFAEPVHHINAATLLIGPSMWNPDPTTPMWAADPTTPMWSDAVNYASTDYSISSAGLITFNTAPAAGEPLVWNGEFYYQCRFADDQLDFNKFMQNMWTLKTCDLIGSLGSRI